MPGAETDLRQKLREQLGQLVFFHLGSDARVELTFPEEDAELHLEHPRIWPIDRRLPRQDWIRLAKEEDRLEQFFLDLLTAHRRT